MKTIGGSGDLLESLWESPTIEVTSELHKGVRKTMTKELTE